LAANFGAINCHSRKIRQGTTSAKLAVPILELLNIYPSIFDNFKLGNIIYTFLRILIIFPIYQILLIVVAVFFFQFKFFWEFEKKILKRIGFGFLFKKNN
jgi:hypothetical protein